MRRHLDALDIAEHLISKHSKENEVVLSAFTPFITLIKHYSKAYPAKRPAEILELNFEMPVLLVKTGVSQAEIRKVEIKEKISLVRDLGVSTPVIEKPAQYSCPHCGSHSSLISGVWQKCSYCQTETELRTIDWQLIS